MEPPFKLPLRTEEHKGSTPVVLLHAPHKGGVEQLACLRVYPSEPGRAKRQLDYIRDAVNAHERLAEYARRYRAVCDIERLASEENGLDVLESSWAYDIREIDAALALADPAKENDG